MRSKIGFLFMLWFCCTLVFISRADAMDSGIALKIKPSVIYSDSQIPARSETACYQSIRDALEVAEPGDTLVLTENVTQADMLNDNYGVLITLPEITLDLNGYTYKDTKNTSVFFIEEDASLSIKDTGASETGLIQSTKGKNVIIVQTGGKLVLFSGEIKNIRSVSNGIENAGRVEIYGGKVNSTGYPLINKSDLTDQDAGVLIEAGTLTTKSKSAVSMNSGRLCIYGGRFFCSETQPCILSNDAQLCQIDLKGGVYRVNVSQWCASDEYICCANDHADTAETYPWKVISEKTVYIDGLCAAIDDSGNLNPMDDIGHILGGGTYCIDDLAVLTAPVQNGWQFVGWYQKEGDEWNRLIQDIPYSCRLSLEENALIAAAYVRSEHQSMTLHVEGDHYIISGTLNQDGTYDESRDFDCAFGSVVVLTAADLGNFQYWLNDSDKILSERETVALKIFRDQSVNCHRLDDFAQSTQVAFFSLSRQLLLTKEADGLSSISFPEIQPAGIGKIFKGWTFSDTHETADEQAILQRIQKGGQDSIRIISAEESSEETCDVTLVYPGKQDVTGYSEQRIGEKITIEADQNECPEGERFAYWTDGNGKILCFSNIYETLMLSDRLFSAKYIAQEASLSAVPTLVWQEVAKSEKDNEISHHLTIGRTVPEDFQVLDLGILCSTDANQALNLDNADTVKLVASDLSRNGSFTGKLFYDSKGRIESVFCRGFMILNRDGEIYILYTDIYEAV